MSNKLSDLQRKACEEYLIDRNQVNACTRAGYNEKHVRSHANRVFAYPQVKAYLKTLLDRITDKTVLSAERVLEEMARIAFANIADYYKLDKTGKKWVLKDLGELSKPQQAAISEYEHGKYIKLYSKDNSLDKLGKHFKLYTDLEAGVANFNLLPVLRINGKEVIFEVGKPAPMPKTN